MASGNMLSLTQWPRGKGMALKSDLGKLSRDAETLGNSLTILGINLVEKLDHFLLDFSSGTT
jgi:hypothetical protein